MPPLDPAVRETVPDTAVPRPPLTLEQAAILLGVSPRTVRRLIAAGKLRKLPLTRTIRITLDELGRFVSREAPTAERTNNTSQNQGGVHAP